MTRVLIALLAYIAFAVVALSPGQAGASTHVPRHHHHREAAAMPLAPPPPPVYVPPPAPCVGPFCLMWW